MDTKPLAAVVQLPVRLPAMTDELFRTRWQAWRAGRGWQSQIEAQNAEPESKTNCGVA